MPRKRDREFPKAAVTPELAKRKWDRSSICIGEKPGRLDVNFCYNTLCGNFGMTAKQAKARHASYSVRKKGNALMLQCPECGLNRKLYNNEAIDHMFLYVLESHLLHEYCTNPECENYRVNVYENYPDRYYRGSGDVPADPVKLKDFRYTVRCKKCSRRFPIGPPWRLHKKKQPATMDIELYMKLAINGVGPSSMIDILDCQPGRYYRVLHNLAQGCNFLSARQLMELQSRKFADKTGCVRLYSDIMNISVYLEIKKNRTELLPFLVTVTDYGDSFFVLAVTPMFMLGEIDEEFLSIESIEYESDQPHGHMLWGGAPLDSTIKPDKRTFTYAPEGLGGCLVRSGHGAIAHFLLLRKMLSRVKRVVHYVDNEVVLQMGALTGFADMIKAGQCDVVSVGIEQAMKGEKARQQAEMQSATMRAIRTAAAENPDSNDDVDDPDTEQDDTAEDMDDYEAQHVNFMLGEIDLAEGNNREDRRAGGEAERQAYRKQQMETTVSGLPGLIQAETARRTAVRQTEDVVRDVKQQLRKVNKEKGLAADVTRMAEDVTVHAKKVAELAKAVTKHEKDVAGLQSEEIALVKALVGLLKKVPGMADTVALLEQEKPDSDDDDAPGQPGRRRPNDLAYVYRLAINKRGPGEDKAAMNLWVNDPFPPMFEPSRRFLWLTRRTLPGHEPDDEDDKQFATQIESEVDLYLHGEHQPADTYMSSLRQLISTAERSHLIAATKFGRSGYLSAPRLVKPVISEFLLHRFYWNYMRRRRSKKSNTDETRNITRARKLGLNVPEPLTVDEVPIIRRQIYNWAEQVTAALTGGTRQRRSGRRPKRTSQNTPKKK